MKEKEKEGDGEPQRRPGMGRGQRPLRSRDRRMWGTGDSSPAGHQGVTG